MSVAIAVSGTTYSLKNGSLTISDSINMRSTCDLTIEDVPGTTRLVHGMPVSVTDSINGLLFAGFVDQPDEQNLYPNAQNEISVSCMDMHYLADKRRPTADYTNMAAGDIAVDMLSKYLAAEGVTAGYAVRHDSSNTDFAAGTLSGTSATLNVGDGDLELSPVGSDVTKTETTTSDFAAGTLSGVDAQSNQLNLQAWNAIKYGATNVVGNGNCYHYQRVWNGSGAQTIASGDTLTYSVWVSSTSPAIQAGVDMVMSDGTTMRDVGSQGVVDQFNIHAHPGSDLTGFADDQWYTRTFDLSLLAGKTIQFVSVAFEGDAAGTYQAYFTNIIQKDSGGVTRVTFYDGTLNPYNPGAVFINPNTQVSNAGYNAVNCFSVTAYAQSGSRISPAISIDAAKIPKNSLVSWTSIIPSGATAGSSPSGSNAPVTPQNTTIAVYTSIDNQATWQLCSFKAAIPDLMPGCNIAGRSLYTKIVLAITGSTPEVSPILTDITVTVTSSYTSTRHDVISNIASFANFNTGTYTNTSFNTSIGPVGYLSLAGMADYDTTSGVISLSTYLTLFNSAAASLFKDRARLAITLASGGDARARLDASPNTYQDFTAQINLTIPSTGNVEIGLAYRTTGWQNNNDTYAYVASLAPGFVRLGRGTNSGSGAGSFTLISSVALPATLTAGNTYAMTVVVAGSNHKIYVDGVLYVNVTDATYTGAGEIAFRAYNNSGGSLTYYFSDYGIQPALSGTWLSAAVAVGGAAGTVGSSVLQYDADIPTGCSVLCETSVNGGSTWQTATSGQPIPNVVAGSAAPANVQTRFTLTATSANQVVTVHAYTWWITSAFSASGTRVSPALALTNVGRAGASSIYWNVATLPTGASLGVDAGPDGVTWTDVSAYNGLPLPTSLIYQQPEPFLDFFAAVDSGNYAGTFFTGGGFPGAAFDTTNHRLTTTQAAGGNGVYQYAGFSRVDAFIEAACNYSDTGGLVARMVDASHAYYLSICDGSSASGTPNTARLLALHPGGGATTALTLYGADVASSTLSSAGTLDTATGGTDVAVTSKIGTSTGYGELCGLGSTAAWAATGSIGAPTGLGLLWDVTTLEGQTIPTGNWTPALILNVSAGSITTDLYVRFYKRSSGGAFTLIGTLTKTGQTITTGQTTYAFAASSLSAMAFGVGDKLYIDCRPNILTNSTGNSFATLKLHLSTSSSGVANDLQITTPGYQATGGVSSTLLASASIIFTRGDYHMFRLDVQGSALTVFMDNVQILSATDASVSGAGAVGIYAGANSGDVTQIYTLRAQAYGDNVAANSLYTRLRLASTNPQASPQVTDLTLSVRSPDIGSGAAIASTSYAYVKSVAQSLDDLATQSTSPNPYVWWIGNKAADLKKLKFRQNRAAAAPFYVWPNAHLLWSHRPIVVSRPDMLYRNRQIVDGGFDTTTVIPEIRVGDGFTQTWTMTYPLAGVPTITQTNPVISQSSAPATVGVLGVDTGKDFYYTPGSNIISQDLGQTPPSDTDILSFAYVGQKPVRVVLDNVDGSLYPGTIGQVQMAAIDGTSGIVEDYVSIPGLSLADATAHAQGLLQQYGYLGRAIAFAVKKYGLAPGQLAPISLIAQHGIVNAPFVITKVTTTMALSVAGADPDLVGNVLYCYDIEATEGPFIGDFTTFFTNLLEAVA